MPERITEEQLKHIYREPVRRRHAKWDLFERVRIPLGRLIVGFRRGGVVYVVSGNRAEGFTVERSTLSRW